MLSPVEDFWLRWHVEHGRVELAERARLVLQAEAGGTPGQVAASLGLSTQTVEGILSDFAHDRLAAFPRPSLRLEQLIRLDPGVSESRQHVAHLAKRLFSDTRPLHHLNRRARQLLEAAGLLPPVAGPASRKGIALRDMDLLDGAVLADYSAREQAIISSVLHLQRKGYRADRDPVFRRLRPTEQSQARYLAALLQVAAELDHSKTQSTTLLEVDLQTEAVVLWLSGPNAHSDGSCACRRATFWQPVFHLALEHAVGPRPQPPEAQVQAPATTDRDEPVGAIFGRQMIAALHKWQASLPGVENTNIAGWGDLLAGVTEAYAALGAFASVLKRQPLKQVKRPVRELTGILSAVLDRQNALSDLDTYCSGRPQTAVAELQPLREAWERSSRRQQAALRTWLASDAASRLYDQLTDLALTSPVRRRKSTRFRVAAPVLLDELCSDVAESEASVIADRPETYRQYRYSLARLACALRALRMRAGGRASLGEDIDRLLADIDRVEGRIDRWLASSALNDAIAEFLDTWAEQQARRKAPQLYGAQSVLAYRQARRSQWSRLRSSLPTDWRPVRASRLRRRINSLLKQLEHH